ncbi:MAG: hypothetical protein ACXADB_05840 [Candidatus Hermodarchaeia archaeon]|jgi:hypothetical protein
MRLSKTTKVLLITAITVAFIAILLALYPPKTTSVKGIAPSSSGMKLSKTFMYEYLLEDHEEGWKESDYYISGLYVELYKGDCDNLICHGYTDELGTIRWDGLTEGWYYIVYMWNGERFEEWIFLCCNKEIHEFALNLLPPKDEDGAFSSFSSEVASLTSLF